MEKIKSQIARFARDESGQSTTEYILILAVVVMVAMKFKTTFQSKLIQITNDVGTNIDNVVKDTSSGNY